MRPVDGCRLPLVGEVREQLSRGYQMVRVERLLDRAHDVERRATVLRLQKSHLPQADAMLAAACAAKRQGALDEPVGEPLRLGDLLGRLRFDWKDHVEVAVAD